MICSVWVQSHTPKRRKNLFYSPLTQTVSKGTVFSISRQKSEVKRSKTCRIAPDFSFLTPYSVDNYPISRLTGILVPWKRCIRFFTPPPDWSRGGCCSSDTSAPSPPPPFLCPDINSRTPDPNILPSQTHARSFASASSASPRRAWWIPSPVLLPALRLQTRYTDWAADRLRPYMMTGT